MPAVWKIENIEQVDGSNAPTVHWRVNNGLATTYGTVSIDGLTITPSTTEASVIQRVKEAINAYTPRVDERGNAIPPMPGEQTAKTDAIEASLAKQAEELAHPTTHNVALPWAQPAPSPAPPPATNKKSGAK